MTGFYAPCHMYPHLNTEDMPIEQLLSRSSHHVKPVPCPPRAKNIGNRSNCNTANENLHREESHVDDVNTQKSRMNEDPVIHCIDLNLNSQIPWTTKGEKKHCLDNLRCILSRIGSENSVSLQRSLRRRTENRESRI